ncbi:MAG: GNAT family N-acetyltransferase [Bacillota bacterium]|nr:GNAT family N-acetyltransferase [Bacillota bacterium]
MYIEMNSADNLPAEWDLCVKSYPHLLRASLGVLERTNPCSQKYVAFLNQAGTIDSAMVLYRLKLNLLTYSSLSLPVEVTMVGIPCSVAAPGYIAGEQTRAEFESYVSAVNGLVVILNSEGDLFLPAWSQGVTLPSCRLRLSHSSFAEYLGSMRSHYRYRYRTALKKGRPLHAERLEDNGSFGDDLYALYEQVYEKSGFKLEKLPITFFQQAEADIYVFNALGVPVGFVQLKQHAAEMQFLFGGIDYSQSSKYDTYVNMLLFIVQESIARKCKQIDFGQTAEDAKAKLGCKLHGKFMYVRHSNALLNLCLRQLIRFFDYKAPSCDFRVFNEKGELS